MTRERAPAADLKKEKEFCLLNQCQEPALVFQGPSRSRFLVALGSSRSQHISTNPRTNIYSHGQQVYSVGAED